MQQEAVFPIGSIIRDHYIVESLLGKGAGDPVYLVRERWGKQDLFVLKERIDLNKQERDRFVFEGVVLKQLYHPALQRVYRVFEENSQHRVYMLMQYISGPNLETMRLQWPNQSFSLPLMLSIMSPVIDAITYLHSRRDPVVHRDINPSNIIVLESKRAVLVNFSIDRKFDLDNIASVARQLSPGYAAPEQYRGEGDPRTDLYALAATFYTVLTGIVPPDARDRIALLGSRGVDPLVRADEVMPFIPAVVGEAIHRAMSMSSDERFSSVSEFWLALQASPVSLAIQPEPLISDESLKEVKSVQAEEAPIVSNESAEELQEQPQQVPEFLRLQMPLPAQPSRRLVTVLLLMFVLALLLSVGGILWSRSVGSHSPGTATSSRVAGHRATPVSSQLASTVSPKAVEMYMGTIHDIPANISASISLTGIQLRPGAISGYLLVGNGLKGSGPYKGTVSVDRHIQFVVMDSAGHAIFAFEAGVQPDGNIAGSYCALNQNDQCSGDYGLWSIAPALSSALAPWIDPL